MALVAERTQNFVAVYTGKSDVTAHTDVEWVSKVELDVLVLVMHYRDISC